MVNRARSDSIHFQNNGVLIVGAGPTGLALALWLANLRIPVRIVDKAAGPGRTSRAIAVHARTLEFYRQLGIADAVVRGGIIVRAIGMVHRGRPVAQAGIGDIGREQSPYPFVLSYPQDDHEKLLAEELARFGVSVEWNTELTAFTEKIHGSPEGHIEATLRKSDGSIHTAHAAYLAGCDGARSRVREELGVGFPGGTYEQLFFVADVPQTEGRSPAPTETQTAAQTQTAPLLPRSAEIEICLDPLFCLVLPVRSTGNLRLIGIVPDDVGKAAADVTLDDVREYVREASGVEAPRANWFSTYHVHHRVAESFRRGRAFLLGDAAHIHSPAGGQGMNTGIGDASNLAWKLAAVLRGEADASLLDTYAAERTAIAYTLVRTTDRLFRAVVGRGALGDAARRYLLPFLFPRLTKIRALRTQLFRIVSQIRIRYRRSALSFGGERGRVLGGDRLPWIALAAGSNYDALKTLQWQLHVYGGVGPRLKEAAERLRLPLYEYPWSAACGRAGLRKDGFYFVRPDGYISVVGAHDADAVALRALEKIAARFARPRPRKPTEGATTAQASATAANKPAPGKRSGPKSAPKTAPKPARAGARSKSTSDRPRAGT